MKNLFRFAGLMALMLTASACSAWEAARANNPPAPVESTYLEVTGGGFGNTRNEDEIYSTANIMLRPKANLPDPAFLQVTFTMPGVNPGQAATHEVVTHEVTAEERAKGELFVLSSRRPTWPRGVWPVKVEVFTDAALTNKVDELVQPMLLTVDHPHNFLTPNQD